jgi:hypothetical protein
VSRAICSRWGQESPVPKESAKETVKTIAQGMPGDPAEPVVPAAGFSYCRRATGEVVARHSLRPLFLKRVRLMHNSGDRRRESYGVCLSHLREGGGELPRARSRTSHDGRVAAQFF